MTVQESHKAFLLNWPEIQAALGKFAFATAKAAEAMREFSRAARSPRRNRRRLRPRNYRARSRRAS